MYMYFGFHTEGLADPVKTYEEIEEEARWAMMKAGGSLSHHHGIGKMRKKFMPQVMAPCGLEMIKGLKEKIDPKNTFATNNIIDVPIPAATAGPEGKTTASVTKLEKKEEAVMEPSATPVAATKKGGE